MKGERSDLSENLGRDAPEGREASSRTSRPICGDRPRCEHVGERIEVSARVVGERARLDHALEVWVARFGGERGTGGEQDRVDTSYGGEIPTETSFSLRNCEI